MYAPRGRGVGGKASYTFPSRITCKKKIKGGGGGGGSDSMKIAHIFNRFGLTQSSGPAREDRTFPFTGTLNRS